MEVTVFTLSALIYTLLFAVVFIIYPDFLSENSENKYQPFFLFLVAGVSAILIHKMVLSFI
jgi:hypothetical protein